MEPHAAAKIFPNLFASSIVIVVFLITELMTKDDDIALLSALVSGFIPVYISETINSVSAISVVVPIAFFLFYLLLRLKGKAVLAAYIVSLCLFIMLSAYSMLVVLAMLLFLALAWVEGFKPAREEIELTIFSVVFAIWFYFIFFSEALHEHGFGIIYQNIPVEVFTQYYSDLSISSVMFMIGIVPLFCGIAALFLDIYGNRKKTTYLLVSFLLIIVVLLLQKYIQLHIGLAFIGIILSILFGEFLSLISTYIQKTRFNSQYKLIAAAAFVLVIFSSIVPGIRSAEETILLSDPGDKVVGYSLIKEDSDPGSTVAGSVFDGHLITYTTERKNIIDSNFLIVEADERLSDLKTLYLSAVEGKAVEIMRKYGATYLTVTDEAKDYYNITRVSYVDSECFEKFFAGRGIQIYKLKC